MTQLPVLDLGPDPRERGRAHGKALHAEVRDNLATYLARFEAGGSGRAEVMAEAERWQAFIARDTPDYAEEMAAIAEGAALSATELALLNARYEITYCLFAREAAALAAATPPEQEGCTSFGALPAVTRDGHSWIGQNWDWLAGLRGRTLITRVRRASSPGEGLPDFVGFTEAGIAGCKMGVNAAGIGLCVNGLVTDRDGANGLRRPLHVRTRQVLDAWTLDKALAPILATDRTCSTNFLIGQAGGDILNIEATPDFHAVMTPQDGLITHANHLVKETRLVSRMERIAPHTLYRDLRLARHLRGKAGAIDLEAVAEGLGDHLDRPNSVCRHPDESLPEAKRVITVAAIAIDLDSRVLYATDGQVCQSPFHAYPLVPQAAAATTAAATA